MNIEQFTATFEIRDRSTRNSSITGSKIVASYTIKHGTAIAEFDLQTMNNNECDSTRELTFDNKIVDGYDKIDENPMKF